MPCFIPCAQYNPIQLQIKGFQKFQLYIIWKLHAKAHFQTTYSQFQYLLGKHNSKVHGVPWNKPAKLCVLCNKFFSLFMLNAEAEYLLNTQVVLYSFILPYIGYMCTPQFVYEKLKFFHYVGRHTFQTWCALIRTLINLT